MSRIRHHMKERASGGKVVAYAGGDSNVLKEAKERKRGGHVKKEPMHGEGEHSKRRSDRRARGGHIKFHHLEKREHQSEMDREHEREGMGRKRGGHVEHEHHGKVEHHHVMHRGRKRGGGIGANLTPLSTAARIKEVTKGESKEDEPKNPKGLPSNP